MKKRVGIMGGTFNPIHLGHMLIAENAYETYNLDEILFIPSGDPYMKSDVLDVKTRVKMTGMAIEDNPHFAMSTIEADTPGPSYSYETISKLKEKYPENEYYFIVGADTYVYMENWKCPEKIFSEVEILVATRETTKDEDLEAKISEYALKYGAKTSILSVRNCDISSSYIRHLVNEERSIRYLVHYKVVEYIKKNNLYKENNDEALE